jgi:hypothetical protein
MFGLPPGVPGGGITGILPPATGGLAMPGSTPAGGQITPLDCDSSWLRFALPVVSLERGTGFATSGGQSRRSVGNGGGPVDGFVCASAGGASIFKMMDQSRHRSMDTLRGYVRDAHLFRDHAGAGLL